MARLKRVSKIKIVDELWKIVKQHNDGVEGVNATHKINALAAIAKLNGYNEPEKSETTLKDMTVTLKF